MNNDLCKIFNLSVAHAPQSVQFKYSAPQSLSTAIDRAELNTQNFLSNITFDFFYVKKDAIFTWQSHLGLKI